MSLRSVCVHAGRHVGLGLLFLLCCYWVPVPLISWYFPIRTGIRLACLLCLPYRYWPAVLLADGVGTWHFFWGDWARFGSMWWAFRNIPTSVLMAPLVWGFRRYWSPFPARHLVDVKALLACMVATALLTAAYGDGLLRLVVHWQIDDYVTPGFKYLVSDFIGLLTVLPWVVIARLDIREKRSFDGLKKWLFAKASLETAVVLLPSMALLLWLSNRVVADLQPLLRLGCFLPAAWLTLRHGWRVAALTGSLVLLSLCASGPDVDSVTTPLMPSVLQAIAASLLLAVGARVSVQAREEAREKARAAHMQRLSQQNLLMGEQRMRQMSHALEVLASKLHVSHARLLEQVRVSLPDIESQPFYQHARTAQEQVYRLAESMHPVGWRERGLPGALTESVGRALSEAGIDYACRVSGRGYARLDPSLLSAAYRMACEAVVQVVEPLACHRVTLILRTGKRGPSHWIALKVQGHLDEVRISRALYQHEERQRLAPKLGVIGLGEHAMRDQAELFGGSLRISADNHGMRVSALLFEPFEKAAQAEQAARPMWVD